jgi:hypothetical protein
MPTPQQGRQPLNEYLAVQVETDRELFRVLELAARQASGRVRNLRLSTSFSAGVRAAQLEQVIAEVVRAQRSLWTTDIGPIILRSYPKAYAAAQKSFGIIEELLIAVFGEERGQTMIESFRQTARAGLELDRVRRARDLSPRVYRNAALSSGHVERTIRAGIIQGLSAKELAANVKKFISPQTPGGASYAAMRLARTELNNAFHEAQKVQGEAPWVKSVEWNLSKSHPVKKDRCDLLATQNLHGLGRGCYPAEQVPDKPHPQCLCFTTYKTISETEMLRILPGLLDAGHGGSQIA